jgi:hypothetical protein
MVTEISSNHNDAHAQNSTHVTQNTNIKLRLTRVVEAAGTFPFLRWGPCDSYSLSFPFGGTETNM